MEALSEVLESLRVTASLVSRAELGAPWSVRTEGSASAIFHVVAAGECLARWDGQTEYVRLVAGDTLALPRGHGHILTTNEERPPVPITSIAAATTSGIPFLKYGGKGPTTSLLCGSFRFERDVANTLVALFPPAVVSRGNPELASWLTHTLALVDAELERGEDGTSAVVNRLVDVIFAEVLRRSAPPSGEPRGFFTAMRDPQIGRAMATIHSRPGERWSVDSLASTVGLSRTRFYERFTDLVGESPARYLVRWRVTTAADMLRSRDLSTRELATSVGYESEEAFARAFKRHVGVRPSEYRRSQR